MPTHAPRSDTAKKREQLVQREIELRHVLRRDGSRAEVTGAIERLREARLSLLKARLHWALEAEIRRVVQSNVVTRDFGDPEKIRRDIQIWNEKSAEVIVAELLASSGGGS